ncbi:MAG: hypothetical protein M5U01_04175 [Ardenticatenaceae bacterium]|nr:hypothetical protein [Ardenticatenaceae bacterium]
MPRRTFLSLIIALMLVGVGTAYAGFAWMDPIFEVNGTIVMVDVGYNLSNGMDLAPLIKGTRVTLSVPDGVKARLVDDQGAKVKIQRVGTIDESDKRIPITATVEAPDADGQQYPLHVTLFTQGHQWQRGGQSGGSINISGWLDR